MPEQQLSLFVIPAIVIIAWITGYPLGLLFDPFESIALYLASMCFPQSIQQLTIDSQLTLLFCALSPQLHSYPWCNSMGVCSSHYELRRGRWTIQLDGRVYSYLYAPSFFAGSVFPVRLIADDPWVITRFILDHSYYFLVLSRWVGIFPSVVG